jgi:hypothetical protein
MCASANIPISNLFTSSTSMSFVSSSLQPWLYPISSKLRTEMLSSKIPLELQSLGSQHACRQTLAFLFDQLLSMDNSIS